MQCHELQYSCQFSIFRTMHHTSIIYSRILLYYSNSGKNSNKGWERQQLPVKLKKRNCHRVRALRLGVTLPPGLSIHIENIWPITLEFAWKRKKSWLWVRTGQLPWLLRYIILSMSPVIDSPFHSKFFSFVLHNSLSHFQALQKICLASHIRTWQTYCMPTQYSS